MNDATYLDFHVTVRYFYALPDTASAIHSTRAFLDVRREMRHLLNSLDETDDEVPYADAYRLIEHGCKTELAAYLRGDASALIRLKRQVAAAERLLP